MTSNTTSTAKCATKSLYASLPSCDGKTYLSGVRRRLYFIPKSKILVWPSLPSVDKATDMASMGAYSGNFTLAVDAKWMAIDGLTAKNNVQSDGQGTKPYKSFLNKVTIQHPGMDEAATGFCRQANGDELVYLAQQANGKFRVIGSEMYDIETKPTQKSGEGPTGEAGTTIEVEATDQCPAPFYPGKIETEDGDISGVDGSAWVNSGGSTSGGSTSGGSTSGGSTSGGSTSGGSTSGSSGSDDSGGALKPH
jgi:hypothetical protein